jgi:hypothetical protein
MSAPTILYEGVPDDGSAALTFSGRGAHHAAAAAVRFTGGRVYRLTPQAATDSAGATVYRTARVLVMTVAKVPPLAPEAPMKPIVDL